MLKKIWYKMYELCYYYGRRSVAIHAMSGIDMAIWDIMGKKLGMPVHKLLGGSFRDKIPAYCSVLMPDNEDEIKRIADTYLPQGYTGIKFGWGALGQSDKRDLELVHMCRKAMGDDPKLMIDIGMVWRDYKTAVKLCNEFEQEDVYWVEEPFKPDDLEAYKRLTHAVNMRISAGEEVGTMFEFNELIDKCGIDIIQPDISRCGGITIAKKVIDMAYLHKIPVIPHAFKTGILMSASLQVIGATGEKIISKKTIELMSENQLNAAQMKAFNWSQLAGYGYGLGVRTLISKELSGSNGSLSEIGWGGAAGATLLSDPKTGFSYFYAHHMLNPQEDYYQPRLRNAAYESFYKYKEEKI